MNNQRGSIVLWVLLGLALLYFFLLFQGCRGWGYPSYYGGYIYRPSFWYWTAPTYYHTGASIRSGSPTGARDIAGGGPRSGK